VIIIEGFTLIDQLYDLWKRYVDYYVVDNPHLKDVYFHVLIGIILRQRNYFYVESGEKRTTRIHCFSIQDSGTGKSQIMKAMHWLLYSMGIDSRYTTKDNEASLTGTIYINERTGNKEVEKGMLSRKLFLAWDEGNVLLGKSPHMDVLTDYFQSVMDEPGMVNKGMKLGTIEYNSPTTIVAGSYMFSEFKDTLLNKGFLQRMYVTYKDFTEEEKKKMRIGVMLLKKHQNPKRVDELRRAFKVVAGKIPNLEDGLIVFNADDIMRFNIELEKLHDECVAYQFSGEKQNILETFFNRYHILVDKVAAQRAIVNGRKEVMYDDMIYGLEKCKFHIDSLLDIFDYLKIMSKTGSKEDREQIIVDIIRKNTGIMNQSTLLKHLKAMKDAGKWDLGINRSIELIDKMVKEKRIHEQRGESNSKILIAPSPV
jgi:hypothetical protein